MKCYILGILVIIYVFLMSGCHSLGKSGHDGLNVSDCLPERKNIDTLSNQSGSILMVGDRFVILSQNGESRYLACNLPETYKKGGLKVKYTLVENEIFPNERHMARPCYLTKIDSVKPE
jgi:hypothetical protein